MQHPRITSDATGAHRRVRLALAASVLMILIGCLPWLAACTPSDQPDDASTSSTVAEGATSGDVEGTTGTDLHIGAAVISVKALLATFQPATPAQRLAEETPSAPGEGESFYQAYVRVMNTSQQPLRVDPNDFACAVGKSVVGIDPTRSGPLPRSILKNTSIDLILTFKAPAGFQPVLLYNPPWYQGVISIGPAVESTTTTT